MADAFGFVIVPIEFRLDLLLSGISLLGVLLLDAVLGELLLFEPDAARTEGELTIVTSFGSVRFRLSDDWGAAGFRFNLLADQIPLVGLSLPN